MAATTLGGIYVEPAAILDAVTFESCWGRKGEDNITTGSINNNIMITTAWASGASLGVGMKVTGSGVAANTVITGSLNTEPLTETVTITIASPGVINRTAHGLSVECPIMLYNSGNSGEHLPTGLSSRTIEYVKTVVNADSFTVSATSGGTVINTSGTQLGTHYLDRLNGSTGLSGYSTTGTWRVSPGGQSVASIASGTTLTVLTAPDWVMPTATEPKTSLKFLNCTSTLPAGVTTGLDSFDMLFTSLPGETGAKSSFPRYEGQEYNIVDGALITVGTGSSSSITTTTLTVGGTVTGRFSIGDTLSGTGITAGTKITAYVTGAGGSGTYTVSPSNSATGTIAVTASNIPIGVAVTGGGNQHIKVSFNGTDWIRCG